MNLMHNPRAYLVVALVLLSLPLRAGGNRESTEVAPPPDVAPAIEVQPETDEQTPVEPDPLLLAQIEQLENSVASETQRNEELTVENQRLNARAEELEELIDEAQFMLSLFAPDQSLAERLERGESPLDLEFEERADIFARPTIIDRISRTDPHMLVVDVQSATIITHPRFNRLTESTVVIEIERTRLETTAAILVQVVTPVGDEPLYVQSVRVSAGSESRFINLSRIERVTDGRYRLERAYLDIDERSVDTVRLLLAAESSVEFAGPRRAVVRFVGEDERTALAELLYLYRELGGLL